MSWCFEKTEKEYFQDARDSLLTQYSSKSNNEAIIILSIIIASVPAYQVSLSLIKEFPYNWMAIIVITDISVTFLLRQLRRLIFWSELANAILFVDAFDEEKMKKENDKLKKALVDQMIPKKKSNDHYKDTNFVPTYMRRLQDPTVEFVNDLIKNDKRVQYWILRHF